MKKNKKLLTLALLSVLSLSSCGTNGGSSSVVWWNPTTWDFGWVEYLNPATWFHSQDTTLEEEVTSDDSQVENTQGKQPIIFDIALNAFGIANKKTVTITTVPTDAYVDLTWTVDKTQVVVTKTGQKTADIYVTDYYAGFATVTVTDAITSLSATGKVYSVGQFAWGTPGTEYDTNYLDASSSKVAITSTNSLNPTASPKKIGLTNAEITNAKSASDAGYPENGPIINWNDMMTTVYVHIKFNGSYAPMIYNATSSTMFGGDNTTLYAHNLLNGGGNIVSIPVTLVEGENVLVMCTRNYNVAIASQTALTQMGVGNGTFLAFKIYRINPVTGMSIGDNTFFE